jgi:hypothetical protein
MHTSNSWGAPDVNLAFTIPAFDKDGFPPRIWLDVKGLVPVQATRTKQWRRLVVVGANAVNGSSGNSRSTNNEQLSPRNISWPLRREFIKRVIAQETDYGVESIYRLGSKIELPSADIRTTDAGELQIKDWWNPATARPRLHPHSRPCEKRRAVRAVGGYRAAGDERLP